MKLVFNFKYLLRFIKNDDYSVDGNLGIKQFKNKRIKINWLLPVKMTGQSYTIKCGAIGKIFENDPLQKKIRMILINIFEKQPFITGVMVHRILQEFRAASKL